MKTIILNITFLLFGAMVFAQTTWTVDNRPGTTAQFSNLQTAIDAATAGDIIYIHPSSTAYGSITIAKQIHLRGIGHGPALSNGENAKISSIMLANSASVLSITTSASGSSISGLEIPGNISDNGFGPISNVLIQNNKIGVLGLSRPFNYIIQGNIFDVVGTVNYLNISDINHGNNVITNNIFIRSSSSNSQIDGTISRLVSSDVFSNNLMVFDNTGTDKIAFNSCNNAVFSNNMFLITSRDAVSTTISTINNVNGALNLQNCLTFAYGGQTLTALNGINNLNNTNPQFVNIGSPENPVFGYTKNYKLSAGSPAITAGSDGTNIGIFGQLFLFQMKGYPFDLPYPTSLNINNTVVEAGGTINVVLKASANVEN